MTAASWFQLILYVVVLLALARPLGTFMANVYEGKRTFLHPLLAPVERLSYRLAGIRADQEMNWKAYALAVMIFNVLGLLVVYLLQRVQAFLRLPAKRHGALTAGTKAMGNARSVQRSSGLFQPNPEFG